MNKNKIILSSSSILLKKAAQASCLSQNTSWKLVLRKAFTLIELMVVVAIIALLTIMTLPSIRAMSASSARNQAYNTINAALQGARSYAIMHRVNTAARFQPNGKIVIVYHLSVNPNLYVSTGAGPVPFNTINNNQFIYLPVIDQEPLILPSGYAVVDPNATHNFNFFEEPFYVCYNPAGNIAVQEPIWVALYDTTNYYPINPDFNYVPPGNFAWISVPATNNYITWRTSAEDPSKINTTGVNNRKLARFYYVAINDATKTEILNTDFNGDKDYGIDHYAGNRYAAVNLFNTVSVSQIALFPTPENWSKLNLFSTGTEETKNNYVYNRFNGGQNKDHYETIFINPYTGRIIKALE